MNEKTILISGTPVPEIKIKFALQFLEDMEEKYGTIFEEGDGII